MRYRPLGKTGLQVSEIGFGAWGIGGRTVEQTSYGDTDDRTSLAALDRALERGITFFDTSAAYGNGHSEALIGQAVRGRRSRAVITTKAGYEAWDQAPDFSPSAIVASTERSLARLGTDYLDLLQIHNPPLDVVTAPAVREALAGLVKSGKIRAWGVSAKGPDEALQVLRACEIAVVQANFNMMDVRVLSSGLLAEVERLGVGFIARTPLCFGFLSGTIGHDSVFPAGDHRARWPRAQLANWVDGAADLMAAISTSPGEAAAQAALRFCLSFPAVSTAIPGIMKPLEADQNAAASLLGPLTPQAVDAILQINRNRRFFVSA
jgi:aryl-alcohol dehydrogenase-like predicted oxidoreductase